MSALPDLVDPAALLRLGDLSVVARTVVEGLRAGVHRSPRKGQSVDFADHRPYVAGDDLRHLDWKVLGRSDRLVLKRYEAETDLDCSLAVDGSASMGYRGSRAAVSKYRYASMLAASVALLTLRQGDRAGLTIFAEGLVRERPPAGQGQLERLCRDLEDHTPAAGTQPADLARLALPQVHRGLVVLLSDCLCEPRAVEEVLDRLRRRGHDVALVWILDPDEVDLGVDAVSRFEDLEGEAILVAEPRALRVAYRAEVEAHRLALQRACHARRVIFTAANTAEAPAAVLHRLLSELAG